MKGLAMLRVEQENELIMPVLQGSGTQQFHVAEQVLYTPLWHIQVLPKTEGDPDERVWNTYLVTESGRAAALISAEHWDKTRVHVLVPAYMTTTGELVLAKCLALWECRSVQDKRRETWLFETDLGEFVDLFYGVEPADVKKLAKRWQQNYTEAKTAKTAKTVKRTSKQ